MIKNNNDNNEALSLMATTITMNNNDNDDEDDDDNNERHDPKPGSCPHSARSSSPLEGLLRAGNGQGAVSLYH